MYATVSTREAWGRLCFSACVSSLFPQCLRLEPWHHERDLTLESAVVSVGLDVRKFTAMVMKFEPWEVGDNWADLSCARFLQFTDGQHACKLLEYMSNN